MRIAGLGERPRDEIWSDARWAAHSRRCSRLRRWPSSNCSPTPAVDTLACRITPGCITPFAMAMLYTGLGEKDEAFRLLEKAYGQPLACRCSTSIRRSTATIGRDSATWCVSSREPAFADCARPELAPSHDEHRIGSAVVAVRRSTAALTRIWRDEVKREHFGDAGQVGGVG